MSILFTTNNGVGIKMGDTYWYFMDEKMKLYSITVLSWQDHSPAKGFIQFSSEQTANKYKNER